MGGGKHWGANAYYSVRILRISEANSAEWTTRAIRIKIYTLSRIPKMIRSAILANGRRYVQAQHLEVIRCIRMNGYTTIQTRKESCMEQWCRLTRSWRMHKLCLEDRSILRTSAILLTSAVRIARYMNNHLAMQVSLSLYPMTPVSIGGEKVGISASYRLSGRQLHHLYPFIFTQSLMPRRAIPFSGWLGRTVGQGVVR